MRLAVKIFSIAILFTICNFSQAWAQAPKKVKARISYTEKEDKNDKTKKVKKIDERQEFNTANQLIKETEYDDEGKIKRYIVYTYEGSKKISQSEYDKDNKLKEKIVFTYNQNGVLIGKTTYNSSNKVTKKRLYSYEYY